MKKKIIIVSVIFTLILGIISGIVISNKINTKKNIETSEYIEQKEQIESKETDNTIKKTDENLSITNTIQDEKTNTSSEILDNSTPKQEIKTNTSQKIENKKTENKTEKKEEKKEEKTEENDQISTNSSKNKEKTIVIDPGHQRKGDNTKEPIGPGATETKAKVTTGATGVSTKQLESELNLKVSKLLETELKNRGYKVIMTRTSQDVNLSNSERAEIANKANADVFVRIHADSADSAKAVGMSTLCQTANNKYNGNLAEKSYKLSKCILESMTKVAGAKSRGVTRTDNMSGINWAKVPTTIIEMGFLSNPDEDKKLASQEYQSKIVKGIANGIDEFLK